MTIMNNRIAVIGLGYVGLPLAIAFANAGFVVYGIESNPERRDAIRNGENYINKKQRLSYTVAGLTAEYINREKDLKSLVDLRLIQVFENIEELTEKVGAIFICVPTPLTKNKEPDLSYIESVCIKLREVLRLEQLVVLESTSYPGTTEEVVLPILEDRWAKDAKVRQVGSDFYLAFSPERVDPGNEMYNLKNTPKVVGGVTPECTKRATEYYEKICDTVIPASSPRAAEMEKLLENVYRSVNIALVNEMALLCERMGLDIWEIIRLASTKPFGFSPFAPGPGVGGHCIPIDPAYLSWKAKEYDFRTRFIELASEINERMPYHTVDLVKKALNSQYKSLRGASVMVLGVTYKPESSDWRVSPALKVMELLEKEGASVYYNDPYVSDVKHFARIELDFLGNFDCAVICTAHKAFDYGKIVKEAKLLVDTRDATKIRENEKVFVL